LSIIFPGQFLYSSLFLANFLTFHHFSVVLHHFSRFSPGYMTFTQLFAGGERLGYFASYGQRPLARTAALSGGAIDGFIMANYDSMSSPKKTVEVVGLVKITC
jgi:hypothetical protein